MAGSSIGFIGGGRITRIFIEGIRRAGHASESIVVSDTDSDTLTALQQAYPAIEVSPNDNTRPAACDIVFLAVHPPIMGAVLAEIAPQLQGNAVVVSLAPKFTIPRIVSGLGGFDRVARMIPNAASIVGAGYNPIAFSSALPEEDIAKLISFLSPLGQSPVVQDENLEAYAIVTAMGPTYLWFQLSELKKLAVGFGLCEADAEAGIRNMVIGAAKTMFESDMTEEAVIDLIPVKPMSEDEASIKAIYNAKLQSLFEKLKS